MNIKLENLLKFVEFTNLFATIQRKTILNKDGTAENNSQHSFQLAMVAWFISDAEGLNLNTEKIIKFALVHDLMETFSGTSPAYDRTKSMQELKEEEEKRAIEKIRKDFVRFKDLIVSFDEYLKMDSRESKFIYALDKLLPLINIELNNHNYYFTSKTTYEDMIEVKDKKIAKDPTIYNYFELLRKYLRDDAKFFWPDNKDRDYSSKNYRF